MEGTSNLNKPDAPKPKKKMLVTEIYLVEVTAC